MNTDNTKTAPVDVRAVLSRRASDLTQRYGPDNDLMLVLAAVNQLIEAARPLTSAAHDRGLMADMLKGMRPHEADSLRAAVLTLDAALARVQGGAR